MFVPGLTLNQFELPNLVWSDFGDVHCRSVRAECDRVRIFELAPMIDDGLRSRIDGEPSHRDHIGRRAIYGVD